VEHYEESDTKSTFVGTGSHLTLNDEKLKDSTNMANAFNNFSITVTEKLKLEKGDALSILKDTFPGNFPSIKIIQITEAQIKSIIHSLKPKKLSSYDEITSKILNACASLISHPSPTFIITRHIWIFFVSVLKLQ
jgi:hypothetical protein